ncbi:hypothetical protein BJ875DRAFT_504828 [Amylocarpus encephaloides]|uniref:J domain-containing protein n=1 Tax=Amylocarpus encephaloides TaxID=45428 RepID=A0A9P7YIL6_9HELO|nr:hypothetical protein BJ875DRAFT_504828 [Amylocarpus encephaloides]
MNFFSKSPKKSKKSTANDDESQPATATTTTTANRSRSPLKKSSSSSRSGKARDEHHSHSSRKAEQGSSQHSRTFPKSNTPRHPFDPSTTHPLNLPPDQLRRFSALSAMSDPDRMDIDGEGPQSAPVSPPPQTKMPGSFDTPKMNGSHASGSATNASNGGGPAPPPHRSNPTSPAAATPTPDEAEAFKTSGNKYYKAHNYKKAIEEYTKAVEAQPTEATYLNNRAAAYMANGQYLMALEDSNRADDLDPQNPKVLLRLARIYTSLGRPQDALNTFDRIQPPPSAKDAAPAKAMLQHINVAEDALKHGTTGSMALHALDQAEKLLGSMVSKPRKWQLMRGEAYLKMGNVNALGDAQTVAMNLLRNNNADPEALVLRGRVLYAQGDNNKAIQHFRQALSCDPDFREAVRYLRMVQKLDRMKAEGNADYKGARWQAAIDKYTEALDVDPLNKGTNSKLLQNRALCRGQLKDYKGAIADCERALSLEPSYTKARKTKANAMGQSGDWESAVRELKEIQEADPQDSGIAKEIRKAELELKKSKRKDYYKILGVEKDADEQQIKKAYRKAAIIHHPDKNPDDESAATRFQDIGESYETLSDPEKRSRYDSGEDLMDPMEGFGGGGMHGGGMNIDPEILMQMFGAQMGGGSRGGGGGFHSFGGGGGGGGGGMPGGMPGQGRRGGPQGFPGGFSFQ